MSEFIITGKPRGGKSFVAVKFLYQILKDEKDYRPIVTNLPLHLDVIAEDLRTDLKMPTRPDLSGRVRILDDGETSEFWLFEPGHEFKNRVNLDFRRWKMNIPDMENRGQRGCWYIIDEVHIPFPAQFGTRYEGQESLEADLRWFITQHGKMNIDIILITQHPEQINKALRRMAQEYLHVRNLSREPYLGFRIGNMFRYVRSLNSPATANPAPFDSGFHPMDFKKYGRFYDTTKGVGIVGTFIHEQPKRGRPLWILLFPIIGFFCFLYWLVFFAPAMTTKLAANMSKGASAHLESMTTKMTPHKTNDNNITQTQNTTQNENKEKEKTSPSTNENRTGNTATNVYCTGYCIVKPNCYVYFSDGTTISADNGDVIEIQLHSVTINGVTYKIKTQTSKFIPERPAAPAFNPEWGQIDNNEKLINHVEILPTIHSRTYGLSPEKTISSISQKMGVDNRRQP